MSQAVTEQPNPTTPAFAPPPPAPKRFLRVLRSLSWKARIALPLVLVGIGLVVYLTGKSANLHLICQHNLRSGELKVWADDQLVYSTKLSNAAKKKFSLFGSKTPGVFSQTVKVPDGHHNLRVQVVGDGYDQSRTIPVDFGADTQSNVSINALGRNLQVSWKDTQFAPASSDTPWYVRYAKALFITLFGSIISALMGMVVKELLEKLRQPASG